MACGVPFAQAVIGVLLGLLLVSILSILIIVPSFFWLLETRIIKTAVGASLSLPRFRCIVIGFILSGDLGLSFCRLCFCPTVVERQVV